jgi:hypothetical protein
MDPLPKRSQRRVLALISQLLQRPARTDHRLSLIWLSGQDGGNRVLNALMERLKLPARYRVPHTHVDMTETRDSAAATQALRAIDRTAVRWRKTVVQALRVGRLADGAGHFQGGCRRPRQSGRRASSRPPSTVSTSQRHPRQQRTRRGTTLPVSNMVDSASDAGGSVPCRDIGQNSGFGRQYRRFMRQQYLAPLQSVSFLGFAERLTEIVR